MNTLTLAEKIKQERPKITLTPIDKTGVLTPSQQEFNTLMQVYECAGWVWRGSGASNPTGPNFWPIHKSETCVLTKNEFGHGPKQKFEQYKHKILTLDEFCKTQGIKANALTDINEYFEQNTTPHTYIPSTIANIPCSWEDKYSKWRL